jgi:hypothetical protein
LPKIKQNGERKGKSKMITYEYFTLFLPSASDVPGEIEKILNQQGADGWELIFIEESKRYNLPNCYYFKRIKN